MVKNMVIAHGDLDGIISAALIIRRYVEYEGVMPKETQFVFVQPFTVDRVEIPDEVEKVFVVDIAVNNRNPEMTKDFIRKIGSRLVKWVDHHQGWPEEIREKYPLFTIVPGAPSCAGIIAYYAQDEAELWADAEAADTRKGKLSRRGQMIEEAVKANLSDDSVRLAAVRLLLGDRNCQSVLEEAAKKYAEIQAETQRLASSYLILWDKHVAMVDARNSIYHYDLTQLLLIGQELVPFSLVLTSHPQQGEGMTIATSRKEVNMVELFGLTSGAPFRVSLPIKRLDEALDKIAKL